MVFSTQSGFWESAQVKMEKDDNFEGDNFESQVIQHFMSTFVVQKLYTQLFCPLSLALYFFMFSQMISYKKILTLILKRVFLKVFKLFYLFNLI